MVGVGLDELVLAVACWPLDVAADDELACDVPDVDGFNDISL